ncbi:tetratricopeptide repeat protein [Aphanothece sacrum]|uniref:Tetratricopeptide repeat domain protein n=1 Tax=Aphanothece sacrum FPU1 TaxID=1920663 RepID=A0A401IEG8_APHSA|nr:tetratricopeptide repeat protein [Aphanothece sacrum]GBF79682.1 tetratricopeptide repeat domain protein [Aphanothece sacrum FPU1]GBF87142.1 tetratricopeptide repeat protein [Aphanothece sacrum FPU3]
MNPIYYDYYYYYQQGCNLGQQAIQAEMTQNFPVAANLYAQTIEQIKHSISIARQVGQFVSGYVYYSLGFTYFRAALMQTTLGFQELAPNYLTDSLANVNQAIALNPNFFQYHSLAGEILLAQGNTVEAQKAFSFALQLNPMDAKSSWMLSFLYSARQQTAMANQYYQKAHQIQPDAPPIPSNLGKTSGSNWLDIIVQVSTIIKNLSPSPVTIYNSNSQQGNSSTMSNVTQTHSGSGDNVATSEIQIFLAHASEVVCGMSGV